MIPFIKPEDRLIIDNEQKLIFMKKLFDSKYNWREKYSARSYNIKKENIEEYRIIAINALMNELESNITIEFIQNIKTVKLIKDLFRSKENWMLEYDVKYCHITTKTLEKYKNIAIIARKKELEENLKPNTDFKPLVSKINNPIIQVEYATLDDIRNIVLPKIAPLSVTPMKALRNNSEVFIHTPTSNSEVSVDKSIKLKILKPSIITQGPITNSVTSSIHNPKEIKSVEKLISLTSDSEIIKLKFLKHNLIPFESSKSQIQPPQKLKLKIISN